MFSRLEGNDTKWKHFYKEIMPEMVNMREKYKIPFPLIFFISFKCPFIFNKKQ